jgi:hypothetical protein
MLYFSPRRQEGQSVLKEDFKIEPFVPFSEYNDNYEIIVYGRCYRWKSDDYDRNRSFGE